MKVPRILLYVTGLVLLCSYEPYNDYSQTLYAPILMTRPNLEASVSYAASKKMENPGKIYIKDQYLYIIEKYQGIHVIDNSNRSAPVKKGFIVIPGCIDVSIKNNSLFADNAVDLISVNIENFETLSVTSRVRDAFPEITPPDKDYVPYPYSTGNRKENTIIVGWKLLSE